MKDKILELTKYTAPAGSERELAEHLLSLVSDTAEESYIDTLGNAIAHKSGEGPHTLIAAHMDEPGIMVIHIADNGFLRFVVIGSLEPVQLVGRQVLFTNGVRGVIQTENSEDVITLNHLYVDITADSEADALQSVYIGLSGVIVEEVVSIGQYGLMGRAVDNRAGCAIAIEVFRQVASQGKEVTMVFTAQETVGSRGAKTAAYRVQPDWAIVIDGAPSGDVPGASRMDLCLGGGPAIKIMDKSAIVPLAIKDHLVKSAHISELPVQFEVWPDGTSDAGALHVAGRGVPTGGISYPVRYISSTSPVIDMRDVEQCVQLTVAAIKSRE